MFLHESIVTIQKCSGHGAGLLVCPIHLELLELSYAGSGMVGIAASPLLSMATFARYTLGGFSVAKWALFCSSHFFTSARKSTGILVARAKFDCWQLKQRVRSPLKSTRNSRKYLPRFPMKFRIQVGSSLGRSGPGKSRISSSRIVLATSRPLEVRPLSL